MITFVAGHDEYLVREAVRDLVADKGECQLHEFDSEVTIEDAVTATLSSNLFDLPVVVVIGDLNTARQQTLKSILEKPLNMPKSNDLIVWGVGTKKFGDDLLDEVIFEGSSWLARRHGWTALSESSESKNDLIEKMVMKELSLSSAALQEFLKQMHGHLTLAIGEITKLKTIARIKPITPEVVQQICCNYKKSTITDAVLSLLDGEQESFVNHAISSDAGPTYKIALLIRRALLIMYQMKLRDILKRDAPLLLTSNSAEFEDKIENTRYYVIQSFRNTSLKLSLPFILDKLNRIQALLNEEIVFEFGSEKSDLESFYNYIRG